MVIATITSAVQLAYWMLLIEHQRAPAYLVEGT